MAALGQLLLRRRDGAQLPLSSFCAASLEDVKKSLSSDHSARAELPREREREEGYLFYDLLLGSGGPRKFLGGTTGAPSVKESRNFNLAIVSEC